MATSSHDYGSNKRKQSATSSSKSLNAPKRARTLTSQPQNQSLLGPHEALLAELAPKYDVLAASVISSTPIRKRVTYIANHMLENSEKPRLGMLYARTADVCKLITVVEQCKRVLGDEGKAWYQHNQLFDIPDEPRKEDVVEETVLERDGADSSDDDDDFEVMHSRFEDAVLPRPSTRTTKSLRVIISTVPIPELRSKKDVTVQSSEEKKS
ncbi:hypothetical protein G7046_g8182 [Stylonectria norvegica]|nr:hypothetical protein G7046_g8182 [Stylonectria norvegica]